MRVVSAWLRLYTTSTADMKPRQYEALLHGSVTSESMINDVNCVGFVPAPSGAQRRSSLSCSTNNHLQGRDSWTHAAFAIAIPVTCPTIGTPR